MVVAVFYLQLGEQLLQRRRVVAYVHRLVVGPQHRVLFAPNLVPVDAGLGLVADAFDHLLGLLLVKVVLDQLVQRHVVEHGQPLGLADVGQGLAGLPLGDGLAADPQLFGYVLLGKVAFLPGLKQAASETHPMSSSLV